MTEDVTSMCHVQEMMSCVVMSFSVILKCCTPYLAADFPSLLCFPQINNRKLQDIISWTWQYLRFCKSNQNDPCGPGQQLKLKIYCLCVCVWTNLLNKTFVASSSWSIWVEESNLSVFLGFDGQDFPWAGCVPGPSRPERSGPAPHLWKR